MERTAWIVEEARSVGFDLCGVVPVEDWPELARLPEWLERGYCGEMNYLRDPRRASPARVLEGTQSVIVCAMNYNAALPYSTEAAAASEPSRGWISRYAWGDDYHEVVGSGLATLVARMRTNFQEPFAARVYVDTGPVAERIAAKHAGLGWLAKNTCLINERLGSWLFVGVVLTSLQLEATSGLEGSPPDLCGQCRLCLDACPTGAIVEPYVLDARRCISYLTIELRGNIPEEFRAAMGRMVFGCDICQDVCPWNRNSPVTRVTQFTARTVKSDTRNSKNETRDSGNADVQGNGAKSLFAPELEWLASLDEEQFRRVFAHSAVKRAKWRGMVRNACVALGNSAASLDPEAGARILALLERLSESSDTVIAEHAQWALKQLHKSQCASGTAP